MNIEPETLNPDRTGLIERVAACTMQWPFKMWAFGEAIALRGLLQAGKATRNREFTGFVHALLRAYVGRGAGKSPEEHVAPGTELLILYQDLGDTRFLEAAKKLAALHASFPRNEHGARMHRCDLAGWRRQIWVDCMDAEPPFLARLGALTGEEEYFDQAAEELLAYARLLQHEESGLFSHGYESACGVNGQLWARGNGWALMGMVEVLHFLPASHRAREELAQRLERLCAGLRRTQNDAGLWHTILTDPDTFLESTLATMTAYALRGAFETSLLPQEPLAEMEQRARAAALNLVDGEGALQRVTDATPVAEARMYASRPFGVYPWGQGPLLLMLAQGEEEKPARPARSTFKVE